MIRKFVFLLAVAVFFGLFSSQCFAQYDSEPNNTFAVASDLPLNSASSGSVNGDSDPADWYELEIPGDGELTITITHEPSDFQFILYGATENEHITGTETNAPSGRQLFLTLQQGTYRLLVNSRHNSTPVPYTVTTVFEENPSVTQDSEPNDTYDVASALTLDATQTGHIDFMGTEAAIDGVDYYEIDIPQDATVTITVAYEPDEFDFQFILYGADGSVIITGTQTNLPSGGSRTAYLAAGTYYLLINGRSFYTTIDHGRTYYLRVSTDAAPAVTADAEPNDSMETASTFESTYETKGHISFVDDTRTLDDSDYWKFTVPGSKTMGVWVTVDYDPAMGDFQFYVLNEQGQSVAGTGTSAPSPYKIDFQTQPGQHYIVVRGRGQYIGRTYHLSVVYYDPEVGTPTPAPSATPTRTPVPVQTPNSIHSDVNNDGIIDETDLLILWSDWHKAVEPR